MPTSEKRPASSAGSDTRGGRRTVWELDLLPDPSVNKKLSLCNNAKGGANTENSECFTFTDYAKVVSLWAPDHSLVLTCTQQGQR